MSSSDAELSGKEGAALGAMKKHARKMLRLARAGDAAVIGKLRSLLPRLQSVDDTVARDSIKLADVQHAIARQNGKANWAELKQHLESMATIEIIAARLLVTALEGHPSTVLAMLEAYPEAAWQSVHNAALANNVGALAAFLGRDPSLAVATSENLPYPPIFYAAGAPMHALSAEHAAGSVECIRLLLDAGASPNTTASPAPNVTLPVLYLPSVSNNTGVVRLLLERGADPNDGESVYHAAERNHREVLQLLLDGGADLSGPDKTHRNTPIYFLSGHKSFSQYCESSERGIRWLLEHGADPNARSYADGPGSEADATPLHRMADYGKSVAAVSMLVEFGADINAKRKDGRTPYALAVRSGNLPVAEYLRSLGADVADISATDRLLGACIAADRETAMAIVAEHPGIVKNLNKRDRQALALAAEENSADAVRLMIDLGWDITAPGAWGGTPLHHAAWHGRPAMVTLLISFGAPVNIGEREFGSSPIAWAAHGSANNDAGSGRDDDYVAVVNLLLDAGATRAESYNKWNEPPEALGSKAVVQALRARGFAP